jgi:hypothetical protein
VEPQPLVYAADLPLDRLHVVEEPPVGMPVAQEGREGLADARCRVAPRSLLLLLPAAVGARGVVRAQ